MSMHWGLASALLLSIALDACGGGDAQSSAPIVPSEFCPMMCKERVATGCKFSADYESQCEQLCQSRYTKFPQCKAVLEDWDRCMRDRTNPTCSSGSFSVQPQGACASQASPCFSCTGDLLGCAF